MASSGSIWVSLGLKTANFSRGISKAKGDLNGFQKFSKGLKGMFNPLTVGVAAFAGLGVAISNAVGIFNEFEKANSKLKAVLGNSGTAGVIGMLSDQAKKLGSTTAFTAGEVAGLQTELAKLGFNPKEIKNMTSAVLDLAAASGVELADAAANAGAIINAFGLESSDATHVSDVMAASFSMSALDMEKFSETMKSAAPIARATGVSLEVATAAAGKLADANINGSKAGTDLKNIFSQLVKDGKPFAESLNDIAAEMDAASTPAEKLAIAEKLVGERAKGALLILAEQKDELGLLSEELLNADGTAKQMADTMLDNVSGSMTKASSAYEGFVLSIEDGEGIISKSLQTIVDGFTRTLSEVTKLNSSDLSFFTQLQAMSSGPATQAALGIIKVQDAANKLVGTSKSLVDVVKNEGIALRVLNGQLRENVINQDEFDKAARTLRDTTAVTSEVLINEKKALLQLKDAVIPATEGTKKFSKAQLDAAEKAKRLSDALSFDLLPSKEEYKKAIEAGINALKDGGFGGEAPKLAIPITPELKISQGIEIEGGEFTKLGEDIGTVISDGIEAGVATGFSTIGEGLGTALAGGDVAAIGQQFLSQIAGVIDSIGKQMIALGVAAMLAKESVEKLFANPALAIAGGVALVAVAAAMSSLLSDQSTGFAAGGLVTGSVFANVGEGRGTTRANPEVISPLDKLQNMIGGGGGVGMPSRIEIVAEGSSLVKVLQFNEKLNKYS